MHFISSDVIVTADVIPLCTGNATVWRERERKKRAKTKGRTRRNRTAHVTNKTVSALPTPWHCKLTAFIFRLSPSHSLLLSVALFVVHFTCTNSHTRIFTDVNLGSQMWSFSLKTNRIKQIRKPETRVKQNKTNTKQR